ncbi:MAG: hypothetical protein WKF68_09910 [Daejeonella sp.]
MKILVKDPVTNGEIEMDAEHEEYNGEDGWRINSIEHGTFILLENGGEWKVAEGRNLVPELVQEIGIALHPLARYNSLT